MNTSGPLSFEASITDLNFRAQLDAMERRILGVSSNIRREASGIDDSLKRLSQLAAGYFSFTQLAQLPGQLIKVRGEFQQLEIAFTTMLRSKTAADQLLADSVKLASETPFSLKDVAAGAKQLLAYGSSAGQVLGEIRTLGDVASGTGTQIGDLIYLYGTLRSQGRAYAVDIRQFAGRGIPIYAELAKVLGTNVDQVNKFVEDGKVGFKQVEQAFKNMTTSGGLFAGLMEAQSKSLPGLTERFSDAWDQMFNQIGKDNQDFLASSINSATAVVQNYQQVIDILKVVAATYGIYKAAILVVSAVEKGQLILLQSIALEQSLAAAAGEVLTTQQARQIVVSKLLQQAQASLNATMLANPYVLVATAIAALATAYFVFREEVQDVKSAQQIMAESGKEIVSQFKTQGSEVRSLVSVIKNQSIAESERLKAYEKLKSIAPSIVEGLDFQKAKTADLTKAVREYLVELQKKIRLESASANLKTAVDQDIEAAEKLKKAQDALIKQSDAAKNRSTLTTGPDARGAGVGALNDLAKANLDLENAVAVKKKTEQAVKDIEKSVSSIYSGGSKDGINAEITRLQTVQASIKDKLSPAYKQVEEDLKSLTKQRDALTAAENKGGKEVAKTVEYYNDQIKALKESQNQATTRSVFDKIQKDIDALTKQRNRLTGETTAAEKKAAKDADKSGPFGSLAYWEAISKKAQEIIEKTPSSDTGKLAQQNTIKLDADRKAEDIRKSLAVKSFDEEIEEKKKQYVLYQQWIDAYGKKAADEQFAGLLSSGQTYVDFLNSQIAKLEAERGKGTLTPKQTENLGSLITERDEATGKKTALDAFRESLVKAKDEAKNLSDYLDVLRAKQADLNPADNSAIAIGKRLELAEQITATERDRANELTQFLSSYTASEEQRLTIQKKYADLRSALDAKYMANRGAEYQKGLAEINKAEADDVKETQERATQASDAFKKLDEVMLERGRSALKKRLDELNDYLTKEAAAVNTQTYQQKKKERDDTQIALDTETIANFKTFASLAGELGDAISSVNGDLGNTGRLLSGIASQASLVSTAFDETASDADKVAAGVQGLIGIIGVLTSAASQRKQAEEEYYRSVIAQQQQYNLALNDQIGLQAELNENVFVKDFEGRIKDGIAKLNAANDGYQDALKKLSEGQAKTGQGNVVDWSAVGKAAGAGAAVGAFAGPVGAAIGGVVGGIIGFFGGKKKQDEFGSLLQTYPTLVSAAGEFNDELAQTLINQNLVDENTKLLLQNTIDWTAQIKEAKEQIKSVVSELAGSLGSDLRDSLVGAFEAGTSSAQAFGDSVSKVLENVLSQMLFNQVFSKQFDELQAQMEASFGPGGDGSWVDDFGRFFGKADELTKLFNNGLSAAQDAAKQYGLDIFKSTASGSSQSTALSGAIKGVTEDTASVLAGQINAIRITQADTNSLVRQQLFALNKIATNSDYLPFLSILELLDNKFDRVVNGLRAKGII